jgi:hypothetical protein
MDTLHTVHAALIGIQDTPDNGKRAVWKDDARVYGIVLEICYGVTGYNGAIVHTYLSNQDWVSP